MTIQEKAAAMKLDSPQMAAAPAQVRNNALLEIKNALLANQEAIFAANAQDLEQAQQNGVVHLTMNREDLADYLGTTRPSLSRELMKMQQEGFITVEKNVIKLSDSRALEELY